jgi:ureidoglycolate lyase
MNPMPLTLPAHHLNAADFAAYGEVLALSDGHGLPINAGTSQRIDLPSKLDLHQQAGQPVLAVFRARAQDTQGPWQLLERHRLGTQTFVPLAGARCVVLVALGHDAPDPATLAAFQVAGDQGFTLHAGTWHHPLIARDDGDFLVLERQGAEVDCEVVQLAIPVSLQLL